MNNKLGKRPNESLNQSNDAKKQKAMLNSVPSVGRGRLNRLVKPTKVKRTQPTKTSSTATGEEGKPKETLDELTKKKEKDEEENKEEFFECPNCASSIKPPYPLPFQAAIDDLKQQKITYERAMRVAYDEEVEQRKKEGLDIAQIMPFMLRPYTVPYVLRKKICRIHKLEYELKPKGKERGYPESINFDHLAKRVEEICRKELDKIVKRQIESAFLDEALRRFEELGAKARRAEYVIKVFEEFLPGYYGPKGSSVIMDKLNDLYLKNGKLNNGSFKPLTAIEFLQQVLVPECGRRLIQQDYRAKKKEVSLEEARKIMRESTEYGNIMFPKEEDEIDLEQRGKEGDDDEYADERRGYEDNDNDIEDDYV